MQRLPGSRFSFLLAWYFIFSLGVNAEDPFGDILPSNSQLWKSFQEEMKTLEQAAHRVNSLLIDAQHEKNHEDQEAKAAENPGDVTVLASSDKLKNGVLTQTEVESKTEEADKKDGSSETGSQIGGTKPPFTPHLNFGSLINSFGFFKNFPEPWWKGKNVCVEKSEKVEEKKKEEDEEDKHFFIMGTGTFQHCKQTSGKYICTTVTSTPESTKTVSTTYQCCEGFRRQADGCVQGEDTNSSKTLPLTPKTVDPKEQTDQEYLPNKDAVPRQDFNSLDIDQTIEDEINVGRSVEDNSFSSQSSEGNGRPRWLRHYFHNSWNDGMKK